jgi:hypothetical protein
MKFCLHLFCILLCGQMPCQGQTHNDTSSAKTVSILELITAPNYENYHSFWVARLPTMEYAKINTIQDVFSFYEKNYRIGSARKIAKLRKECDKSSDCKLFTFVGKQPIHKWLITIEVYIFMNAGSRKILIEIVDVEKNMYPKKCHTNGNCHLGLCLVVPIYGKNLFEKQEADWNSLISGWSGKYFEPFLYHNDIPENSTNSNQPKENFSVKPRAYERTYFDFCECEDYLEE